MRALKWNLLRGIHIGFRKMERTLNTSRWQELFVGCDHLWGYAVQSRWCDSCLRFQQSGDFCSIEFRVSVGYILSFRSVWTIEVENCRLLCVTLMITKSWIEDADDTCRICSPLMTLALSVGRSIRYPTYQIFIGWFITVARLHLWNSYKIIFWSGSSQHEELC